MKETAEAFGQQRKRKIPSSFVGGDPNKPQRKILRQSGQLDDRIRSLESEIQALKGENRSLKSENEALKRKALKKHACQICKKSYSRSDGLYKHLWEGDDDHKALAQKRYGTRCGSCKTDFKSWVGLQRHTISRHGQDALRSADDLIGLESDETPISPNPFTKISKAEGHTSSATSFGSNRDPEFNMGLPRDECRILDSTDAGQLTEDATTIFSHSTPSRATTCASSLMISGESPGFLDNPVYPLNSAAPRQMIPSLYDITIKEAPSFATNPAYPLNYVALGQISAPSRKAAAAEAPNLATDLAYPPNYSASGQTLPSLYNASTAEAPSFVASPAYPLNYASTPSLYNALDEEAPILSNKVFGSVHPLYNTASLGTPVFSDRWGHS